MFKPFIIKELQGTNYKYLAQCTKDRQEHQDISSHWYHKHSNPNMFDQVTKSFSQFPVII